MPRRTTVDPTFLDLAIRECIYLKFGCGREVCFPPHKLIGTHGITKHPRIFGLKDRCRVTTCRQLPDRIWIDKWRD